MIFKYKTLLVLAAVTAAVGLGTIYYCFAEEIPTHQIASNNKVVHGFVPMSKIQLPDNLAGKAEKQTRSLLDFFKTSEQQLIPLGFYAMVDKMQDVKVLSHLQRHYINLVHKYGSHQSVANALSDLRAAKEAGVGVLQNLPRARLKTKGRSYWQVHISALKDNKQILMWYLPEEMKLDELKYIRQIAEIIESTDDYARPMITYASDCDSEYLNQVGDIVDAVVFGAYPSYYSPRPRLDVRRRIDKAYKSGVPVVFAALEAIHNGKMGPTKPEYIRCDAYVALVSGAKGIMWYCYARARHMPEVMEAVFDVAEELNGPARLGEVLLVGEVERGIKCRLINGSWYGPPASAYEKRTTNIKRLYSSIQWTARKHKGGLYIFAVNMNEKIRAPGNGGQAYSVEAVFESLNVSANKAEVLFEDRTIPITENSFSDKFEPLEVHIYRIGQR